MRLAELMGTLALATDAAMGAPLDHGLRTAAVAARLAELAGADDRERADAYYLSLLRYAGCTADTHLAAEVFGDENAMRGALHGVDWGAPGEMVPALVREVARGRGVVRGTAAAVKLLSRMPRLMSTAASHCEVGDRLAGRIGFDAGFRAALGHSFERWNGTGVPTKLRGPAIARAMRIAHVAEDVAIGHRIGGAEAAQAITRKRRGRGLDPALVEHVQRDARAVCAPLDAGSAWATAMDAEPAPHRQADDAAVDEILRVLGDFADLKSRYTRAHASGVARLAADAARLLRFTDADVRTLERAARVHDVGRVVVSAAVWDKPGPLDDGEWERVRMHTYAGERILSRAPALAAIAEIATLAHERLDGRGYHRRLSGSSCTAPARVLAAADVYAAMTEARAHRPARSGDEAAAALTAMAKDGALCPDAVAAVITAAGHPPPRLARPAGLSGREVEVLRQVARGLTNKEIAAALELSTRTVGHHLEHVFAKIGVTTRAAATLFAMQHGLVA